MKDYERDEIDCLPYKYRPLGAWSYLGYQLLFMIPLVGFICLIVFSLSDANINRRSLARSYFCIYILIFIVLFVVLIIAGIVGAAAN